MTIPFRVKRLTDTAKLPSRDCEGDLWDIYADDFCQEYIACVKTKTKAILSKEDSACELLSGARILIKTGISLELPIKYQVSVTNASKLCDKWFFKEPKSDIGFFNLNGYAVADIRPRSGLALKHGLTVLNSPGTIDNSYRKEIGVILHNAGHEPYTIKKGDKIAQMLIRPLYPSKMEEAKEVEDTGRGGFGSTGY